MAACNGVTIEEPISGSRVDASPCASTSAESGALSSDAGPEDAFDASSAEATGNDTTPSNTGPSAAFVFIINGVVQAPLECLSERWEFPSSAYDGGLVCSSLACLSSCSPDYNSCAGITKVVVKNTGQVPIAYVARSTWGGGLAYVPGVPTGDAGQLAGVLGQGAQVDITSVYNSGLVALLGSSEPFSPRDASYAGDEGTIPWPAGVPGGGGSTEMWIAEIEQVTACTAPDHAW